MVFLTSSQWLRNHLGAHDMMGFPSPNDLRRSREKAFHSNVKLNVMILNDSYRPNMTILIHVTLEKVFRLYNSFVSRTADYIRCTQ